MLRTMSLDEIGGAKVARSFCSPTLAAMGVAVNAKGDVAMGASVSVDALRAIPAANRNCLIENRFIQVWPRSDGALPSPPRTFGDKDRQAASLPAGSIRHVIPTGFGRYMVIEGVQLGTKLSREEAEKLAGKSPSAPQDGAPAVVQAAVATKRKRRKKRAQAAPQRQETPAPAAASAAPAEPPAPPDDNPY